jgi:hypothetical protein
MQDAAPMPSRVAAKSLPPGSDAHYSAYVGPPELFDVMGASQFRLLTALGLREHHKLLDFGCGALRAGRLLLPYLLPGHYHGVEPNTWLLESVIREEIGAEFIALKRPRFRHNADFAIDGFGETFDFILAQSIFSHCGRDLIRRALGNFRAGLAESGLILATFIHTETSRLPEFEGAGWVYPECVAYAPDTILGLALVPPGPAMVRAGPQLGRDAAGEQVCAFEWSVTAGRAAFCQQLTIKRGGQAEGRMKAECPCGKPPQVGARR